MREIGVKFEWSKEAGEDVAFRSLQADDLREVLSRLELSSVLDQKRAEYAERVWRDFLGLYDDIRYNQRTCNLEARMKTWFSNFTDAQTHDPDHEDFVARLFRETDVTPYIHIFEAHCPKLRTIHGPLDVFACDGLEKKGHLHQMYFFNNTMKGGGKNKVHPILRMLWKENRGNYFRTKDFKPQPTAIQNKRKSRTGQHIRKALRKLN